MDDRFNTAAGWVLFSGVVALGLGTVSSHYFSADKVHAPHEGGYPVQAEEDTGGAAQGPSLATLLATGDAAKGEKIFAKCTACHTINAGGANGIGPNLHGVVGEPIGKGAGGFAFSDALAAVGGNWTFDQLDKWLTSPRAFANGTKMSFAGLSNPEDRANVILYLNSQGSNLPLPAPEAAPAADDAAAAGDAPAGDAAAAPAEGDAAAAPAEAAKTEG
ncbi:MAG: cytochrome c family protein [Sphingomonadales bacterium]|nr:cytochrome c family protein [Sphingomonadales bacterium]MBD3772044.1 cytochrome c family protein [Paracoccaceae bacterium]